MKMLLNGEWVDRDKKIEVRDPFDNSVIDTIPAGDANDAELALKEVDRTRRDPPFELAIEPSDRQRLSAVEAHPVNRVDDDRHAGTMSCMMGEDAGLAAVRVDDLRLESAKSLLQGEQGQAVVIRTDLPTQVRLHFKAVSAGTGALVQRSKP